MSDLPECLVILDLDDTLYLEKNYVLSGFKAVSDFIAQKIPLSPKSLYSSLVINFENGVRGNNFDLVLKEFDIPTSSISVEELVQVYRSHQPLITIPSDVKVLLEFLAINSSHYIICLVSDGLPFQQHKKIDSLGIRPFFQKIIITNELGGVEYNKPNPYVFRLLMNKFSIPPHCIIIIADNPLKDFIGPNKLGMQTVRIQKPEGIYSEIDAESPVAAASQSITSMEQAIPIIQRMCCNKDK
jgi:putative hydrolase of the HAD superfamily